MQGEELAAAFLGALAEVIADTIDRHTSLPMPSWDHHVLGSYRPGTRGELLQRAVDRASEVLSVSKPWLKKEQAWLDGIKATTKAASKSSAPIAPAYPHALALEWHKKLVEDFCAKGFRALDDKLQQIGKNRFFIAFDECGALGEPRTNAADLFPRNSISLTPLHRILKAVESLDTTAQFWFLLLDNSPKAFLLAPSGPGPASARLRRPLAPLYPFVHLGFNQTAHEVRVVKAGDALTLANLRKFGRPVSVLIHPALLYCAPYSRKTCSVQYWSTLHPVDVIDFASEKLFSVRYGAPGLTQKGTITSLPHSLHASPSSSARTNPRHEWQ